MGFVNIFWKNSAQDAYMPNISISGKIVMEFLAQLCSGDSIQVPLNLTWIKTFRTKLNLEGFVWIH